MSDRPRLVPSYPGLPTALALFAVGGIAAAQGTTERVSVSYNGTQAYFPSKRSTITPDGRFVVFESAATNLVPDDTSSTVDIFRYDRWTESTTRSSVSSSGSVDDGSFPSYGGTVSSDGRYVAFYSYATNLVPGDTNGVEDVFVHDHQTGTTVRASVDPIGRDGNDSSYSPSISADGRYLAFASFATNLAPMTAPLYYRQVYVRDLLTGHTVLASIDGFGGQTGNATFPAISADGRKVAFQCEGNFLVPGDTTAAHGVQIYVRDLASGVTTRVSVNAQGQPARALDWLEPSGPSISADGRIVAFQSRAPNLVPGDAGSTLDVFVHDSLTGTTTLVSASLSGTPGNLDSSNPHVSPDGRFVAFTSLATNLVPGDYNGRDDVFVRDLLTGTTTRVSLATDGSEASGAPASAVDVAVADSISADGRFVAFSSWYSDLAVGDTNIVGDVFVHDRAAPRPNAYCLAKLDSRGCLPEMSSTGLASATSPAAFDIHASQVQSGRRGILFYSLGSDRAPFLGGLLCVAPPLRRAAVLNSGGNAAAHDCTGSLSFDFNARIRSGVDPDLVPGTVAYAQYLYRDPGDPAGTATGLTDALRFAIQP